MLLFLAGVRYQPAAVPQILQPSVIMRLHQTIILAAFLTSCAAQPSQYGWPPSAGWLGGSSSDSSPGARQRRSGRAEGASSRATPTPDSPGPAAYRVVSDGTVGCANPEALHLLRDLRNSEKGTPRALAQAHRDGRCMTVFQASRWKLEGAEGDVMRLSLLNPTPGQRATTLYFLHQEVEAQP
ncbi:hypothetical protein QMO56_07280 [Roseomonas sp. E05]|uniref:hypothetical protein n=1 Tax=Roseomonas sp. E05 TaxID=3046310 RepID=UPI0024B98EA5|nr:hypothetical protein [Roseomonas sp. E05]MDJ0387912.1 hypothetical protein [Roseomonas sp. E05]